MKHVLVIAGSDPSGGAGVQADLTTLRDYNVPALSCITAITAQNEKRVLEIHPTPADLLTQQLSAACENKEVYATKIGMVANGANVSAVVWFLRTHKPTSAKMRQVIIDPIMHSSTGTPLLEQKAFGVYRRELLPLATIVTPNLSEAGVLVGSRIYDEETQINAAKKIYDELKVARKGRMAGRPLIVVVKGGHLEGSRAVDVVFDGVEAALLQSERIQGLSPRGTGCRFSTAIAAGLAQGMKLMECLGRAKEYVVHYIREST